MSNKCNFQQFSNIYGISLILRLFSLHITSFDVANAKDSNNEGFREMEMNVEMKWFN